MSILSILKSLIATSQRRRETRLGPQSSRLSVETLEGRCLLTFGQPVDFGEGLSPNALVSGDFNGDGQIDLATANADGLSVSALLSNGDGSFQAPKTSAGNPYFAPMALWAADINSDGKDDLVTLNTGPNYLSLLLASGDGSFQPPQTITSLAGYPLSVATGDFNGDHILDVAVGSVLNSDTYVNVLVANGDGTLNLATLTYVPGGSAAAFLYAGDFNNDGRLDLVNGYGLLPGNGDGTFGERVPGFPVLGGIPQPVGDFNGDGNLDLLADLLQGGPFLQLGNGDGTFRQGEYLDSNYLLHSTAAGDVNADGNLDVVELTNQTEYDEYGYPIVTTPTARVLKGNSDGSFADPFIEALGATYVGEKGFTFPVLADFNGDGLLDLAATEAEYFYTGAVIYRDVYVMLNDNDWTPPPPLPPYITIDDVAVTEGNIGSIATAFTVTLSKSWDQPISLAYATGDGSAVAGGDYQAASGTLTIPAGETTGTISVLVNGDATPESDETFFVNLSSADGATIADGQGVGTIVNDDVALPSLTINDVSLYEGRNGTTTFSFVVTLSAPSSVPVAAQYASADGTATVAGRDYTAKSGTLTFLPGETSKTITVSVKGDKTKEADETFFVNLSGATNAQIADGQGKGTILDDDGGSTGGKQTSSAALFDAALDDLLNTSGKKRRT